MIGQRALAYVLAAFCLVGCGGSSSGGGSTPVDPTPPPRQVVIIKGPYLQNAGPREITIMWETDHPASSRVDYGFSDAFGLIADDAAEVRVHEVVLTGLSINTRYHYRVMSRRGDAVVASYDATFRTAPHHSTPFRMAVYGDSRTGTPIHEQVVAGIRAKHVDLDLHTGDFVLNGNEKILWDLEFFDPARDLLREVPLYPVLGNHEYDAQWYYIFFSLPAAASGSTTEAWYAFDYGCMHVTALDSCQDYLPGSAQYQWAVADLASDAAQSAVWRVAIFHHPPFSSGHHGNDPQVQATLVPLFEQFGVHVVFNGHDHAYIRSERNGVHYVVTAGAGAPLYDLVPGSNDADEKFAVSLHHFVLVDVSEERLVLRGVDLAGREFDHLELTAPGR